MASQPLGLNKLNESSALAVENNLIIKVYVNFKKILICLGK